MLCLSVTVIDHGGRTFTKGGTKFNSELCPRGGKHSSRGDTKKGGCPTL